MIWKLKMEFCCCMPLHLYIIIFLPLSLPHITHLSMYKHTLTHTFFRCYHFCPITETSPSTISSGSHLELISMCWSQVIKGEGRQYFTRTFHNLGLLNGKGICCSVVHRVGCHDAIFVFCSWLAPGQGDAT